MKIYPLENLTQEYCDHENLYVYGSDNLGPLKYCEVAL